MLHNIFLPSSLFIPAHNEFLHLKEVTLTHLWGDLDRFGEKITRFCYRLASSPTILPSLNSLMLNSTPQWDIYLLMLKRRNIMGPENISKLTNLGLYEDFPQQLARPVVDLIQGKFPQSLSLYDISVHAALSTLGDLSIPGCMSCMLCFRPCNGKLDPGRYRNQSQSNSTRYPEPTPYPETEDDILSSWEERNQFYKTYFSPELRRPNKCYKSRKFITLTRDSIV
ncbi:hypothetical protein CPB86DRAFT_711910 [Serendipita vermifera]|nr:hypothetical protein CPB86DRAFT_711910 [Serendipita vermifera]